MDKIVKNLSESIKLRQQELEQEKKKLKLMQERVEMLENSLENLTKSLEIETGLINKNQLSLIPFSSNNGSYQHEQSSKNIIDSVQECLIAFGRPATTREILDYLREKNNMPKGKDPRNTLFGILNRYHHKGERFYRENAKWGLLKWQKIEIE